MHRLPWLLYLWPGLPQIWYRGRWVGLAKALGAAVVLNVVMLSTFGWSELTNPAFRKILWCGLATYWTASAVAGYAQTRHWVWRKRHTPAKETFPQALNLYLKGDYFQAECMLVEMLGRNERDLESRLTLATLYRHNRRYDEATKQLDVLIRFDGAEKWHLEIERERTLIAEGREGAENQESSGETIILPPEASQAA